MAKSLDQIKASLKLKTAPKDGALTLKVGKRKIVLPFEVRLLECDNYLFVHVPPAAEILKASEGGFSVVEDAKTAEAAVAEFKKSRRRRRTGSRTAAELPAELKEALNKVPSGFKLVYGADGTPRLAKTRARRKK